MLVICSPAQGPVATVWEAGQVVGQSATQRQDKVFTVAARVSLLIPVTQATCPITDSGRDFLRSTQHRFTPFRICVPPSSNEAIVGVCSTRWATLSTVLLKIWGHVASGVVSGPLPPWDMLPDTCGCKGDEGHSDDSPEQHPHVLGPPKTAIYGTALKATGSVASL